jgi:hypothetical protein
MADGREKARLQEEKGLRPMVEDMDALRIRFGHSAVQVLTPIVETKLRSAVSAARSLKLSVDTLIGSDTFTFCFTYPEGFPKVPVEATVVVNNDHDAEYQSQVENAANLMHDDETYMSGESIIINFIREMDDNNTSRPQDDSIDQGSAEEEIPNNLENPKTVFHKIQTIDDKDEDKYYTCKICRNHLFDHAELHEHSTSSDHRVSCTSLFLEDTYKGLDSTGLLEGKLSCSVCNTRLGSWGWAGMKCSCNSWIAPGFQFIKSKVDAKVRGKGTDC